MAIYLKIEGIDGDVTEPGHEKWILCNSMTFSAFRDAATELGQAAQRQGGTVEINEISLTLPMSAASHDLFTQSVVGLGKKAQIHIAKTGSDEQVNYLELSLDKACITNYGIDSDGALHNEALNLNFTQIEVKVTPVDQEGKPGTAVTRGFSIPTGKAV
jgi:type VI secretion system secreted protein Hcp